MPALKSYDPSLVTIIIGGAIIEGTADGTFINIEPVSDGVASVAGADGEVGRAMSTDPRHTITLTLLQTSTSNALLSALADADKASGGNGAVPVSVSDLRGSTLFSGTGWVVKKAPAAFSKGIESREWHLEAVGEFVSGGNA